MNGFPTAPTGIFMDDGNKPEPHGYGINGGDPVADGLGASWPIWEGAGSEVQDIAGGNTGVLSDSDMWAVGPNGPVLDIGGGTNRVVVPDAPELDLSATDYSIQVRLNLETSQAWAGIISKGDTTNNWAIQRNSNTDDLRVYHGATFITFTGKWADLLARDITLLTVTRRSNDNRVQLWFDDQLMGTVLHGASPINNTAAMNIGSSRDPLGIAGQIDTVGIYHKVLADSEIQKHSDDPYALFRPAPMPIVVSAAAPSFVPYPHVPGMTGGIAV